MTTFVLKTLASLVLAFAFACSPPLESWSGEIDCDDDEEFDIVILFDHNSDSDLQGFFGVEQGNGIAYLPIEDLERKGNEIEFEIKSGDGSIDAELERDGDTMDGELAGGDIQCDVEVDLD